MRRNSTAPTFSVAIPVRNGADYLRACLDSLLAQTLIDFEVFVSDNYSEDNTVAILEEYQPHFAQRHIGFRYSTPDPGTTHRPLVYADNFARAVDGCCGEWITLLCHDDVLFPNCMQRMRDALSALGTDRVGLIAHANAVLFADGTVVPEVPSRAASGRYGGLQVVRSYTLGRYRVPLPGVTGATMRRQAWREHRFDPRFVHCDTFLWLNMLCDWDYLFINEPLAQIRIHPRQGTNEVRRNFRSVDDHMTFWPAFLRQRGADLALTPAQRWRVRLRPWAWSASQIACLLTGRDYISAVRTLLHLPLYSWPLVCALVPQRVFRERRRVATQQVIARTSCGRAIPFL